MPDTLYSKSKDNLKEFSFQQGQVLNYSNCLDARLLPKDIFLSGKSEMLNIKELKANKDQQKSVEYCNNVYGKIFTENLFKPAIKKLTGLTLEEVEPETIFAHNINRIIIADEEESKLLKLKSDFNDSRIAYAKYNNNKSNSIKTFPQKVGYSDFSNRVKQYLSNCDNINLHFNETVTDVKLKDKKIVEVSTQNQTINNIDYILWTIPSPIFAQVLGIDISVLKRPKFRNTIFFHYIFSGNLNTDAFFVYNYDNNFINYRTTLYDNFSGLNQDLLSATVEVFEDKNVSDPSALKEKVFNELIESKILSADSLLQDDFSHVYKSSSPAFEIGFFKQQQKLNKSILSKVSNAFVTGKTNATFSNSFLAQVKSFFDEIRQG